MSQNFNVSPYYDDFDPTKNFHRILFKPGYAVQARELTQSQTILQDQITKFADNIFKQNSPVSGGQVTTNLNCYYIQLNTTYNNAAIDVNNLLGKFVQDVTGTVLAKVISVSDAYTNPTLVVSYKSGTQFTNNQVIYEVNNPNNAVQAIATGATGQSSVASIAQGVFYISGNYTRSDGIVISNGTFVQVNPQTIILDPYDNTPNLRVGLNITETIQDYVGDSSLLDPAVGASNYQAPGADRYQITLTLETRPLALGNDDGFIELIRFTNGSLSKTVDGSVYNVIDDYFAKREFETNGDYVVNDFKLTPKTYAADSTKYTMSIGKGLAYVHGYRVDNPVSVDVVSDRARTTSTQNNQPIAINYGSYFYVDTVSGANASFFDTTTYQSIDLHCVSVANVNTATSSSYSSTIVSSGYIRGLVFDHTSNTTLGSASNNYVYRAYVSDLQNANPSANSLAGATSNTIVFPTYFSPANSAYVGVNISITAGTSVGDQRVITSYNGSSRTATVNQNWTATPDTTSVFALNFDIKDVETVLSVTGTTINANANINIESRSNGTSSGATVLQNPIAPELLFPVGNPYVANLSSTNFTTQQEWRNITFNGTATIAYTGSYNGVIKPFGTAGAVMSASLVPQYFTIIVTNAGTSSLSVGQNIPWTTSGRTVTISSDGTTATFTTSDISGSFTATVIAKVFVSKGDDGNSVVQKQKTLITANTIVVSSSNTQVNTYTFVDNTTTTSTGQIHIQNAGLVSPGSKQSLYLSDVKSIVKILATTSGAPTTANLSTYTDVTGNYTFDNGQRDNYYDHASITLKPSAPQPTGDLLVFVNYYQHSGGDGYFSINSYINDTPASLLTYTSKAGTIYYLRDCVDFRPARKNAQTAFTFRYGNNIATSLGLFLPSDGTNFVGNYSYYLGRNDKLILTKDKSFLIVEGTPSINPILPNAPDGSLVIANLLHDPYTGYLPTEAPTGVTPNLSIQKVKHKRYTMQDIAGLETRINNLEYYTSLNLLEQNAQALQISDAYGLNRFKNGIFVDDFSSYTAAGTSSNEYAATINRRLRQMTATQNVKNFPLKSSATMNNMSLLSTTAMSGLNYNISMDGLVNYFTLPYTIANAAVQQYASNTVNVNPFSFNLQQGTLALSPNMDNWVDTNKAPSLLIVDPNLQIYQSNTNALNVLSAGDWQTVTGTTTRTDQAYEGGDLATWTTVSTSTQTNIVGAYDKLNNTYSINNGYITDISILPYIRPQQVVIAAKGLLINSSLTTYFDNTSTDQYIRKANPIYLTNVNIANGGFIPNDVVGYYSSGNFYPKAIVISAYVDPNSVNTTSQTANTVLYVMSDDSSNTYTATGTIQNAYFDTNGNYQSTTASGTLSVYNHFAGVVNNAISTTQVQLSVLSGSSANYNNYVGNTIYINAGTGVGQSATIQAYYSANQTAVLSTAITAANGDIYSIGAMASDQSGTFNGVFNIPANIFHTGQRVFRVDNSVGGNQGSATTYAQATFYSEGLQTTAQSLDFGASPAGAKDVFTQTNQISTTSTSQWLYRNSSNSPWLNLIAISMWDPVAQTFMFDSVNYPNGLFLNSIKLFFQKKPSNTGSPIKLSIVGTLNGYPNGSTLDHSIVILTPNQVNVSSTPHYLDPTAFTTFEFGAPVYVQPDVLYAFMIHSDSNEYQLYSASTGDNAISSSVKNYPTDPTPSVITKIGSAPYIGALFVSQNSQTWTANQNEDLMFVMDRCVFNTSVSPTIQFNIPKFLPQRTLVNQTINYYLGANSISNTGTTISNTSVLVDAYNLTTTDFVPVNSAITYSYDSTLSSGGTAGPVNVTPGKYGTSAVDNIYLNDNKGERLLLPNTTSSLSIYAQLTSNTDAVSPIISDAGVSAYTITWNINNCPLSNSLITVVNGGSGYNANLTSVTVNTPNNGFGSGAVAAANIVGGVIKSIYLTSNGSGYLTTPTISIVDANSTPGSGASATITGETSKFGGPALARYVSKPVVLDAGFDSGDLNVYLTAYRPVNTDINVYYKILNRNDTQQLSDSSWQLMTKINNTSGLYSQSRTNLYEYVFAPGVNGTDQGYVTYTSNNGQIYTSFAQFAIKIVLTTTDNTWVPFLTDLRAIALPSNINTSV